ncbi:scav-4 [Pristionchus pacificus]|nr:scav-4 [Pristionchus pacificus]
MVKSQIPLVEREDGSYTKLTGFWQKLPQIAKYDFYFFNITNQDEMIYEGAKPHLVEVGPYSYLETEFKEGIEWLDDKTKVHYRSNKTWVWNPDTSCAGCREDDIVTLPNTAYATTMAMKVQNDMTDASILDLLLQATGEGPTSSETVAGMLFAAYDDALLDVINSNLTKLLVSIGGDGTLGGMPVPDVPYMGYLPHYNHTNDEDYILRTGQDDPLMAFQIQQWAGMDKLRWWSGEAAEINGAGDGTFYKPFLEKGDKLKNFQSFSCRAFDMTATKSTTWADIEALTFEFDDDAYDSNKEHNIGYRYENKEYIDYFPDWPACKPTHKYQPWNLPPEQCESVDCRFDYNFCNDCCDGSHYERTIFMPPGIVPLRCFPGMNKDLPFAGFLSPPHFSQSPSQVHETMVGLHPDPAKHRIGQWWINPTTGGTVHALFNMQLSIPIYNDPSFMMTTHMRNCFLPSFWSGIEANLKPYAHNFIYFSAETAPIIAMAIGWSSLILAVIFVAISYCCYRRAGRKAVDQEVLLPQSYSYNVTIEDEKDKDRVVMIKHTADIEHRRESPAQKYPELYAKDTSAQSSLSWKSRTLNQEGEAWS